jgi:hypothetical protein
MGVEETFRLVKDVGATWFLYRVLFSLPDCVYVYGGKAIRTRGTLNSFSKGPRH